MLAFKCETQNRLRVFANLHMAKHICMVCLYPLGSAMWCEDGCCKWCEAYCKVAAGFWIPAGIFTAALVVGLIVQHWA